MDFGLLCPKVLALIKNVAYFISLGRKDQDGRSDDKLFAISIWPEELSAALSHFHVYLCAAPFGYYNKMFYLSLEAKLSYILNGYFLCFLLRYACNVWYSLYSTLVSFPPREHFCSRQRKDVPCFQTERTYWQDKIQMFAASSLLRGWFQWRLAFLGVFPRPCLDSWTQNFTVKPRW